jgi:hypothetical protein
MAEMVDMELNGGRGGLSLEPKTEQPQAMDLLDMCVSHIGWSLDYLSSGLSLDSPQSV